MATASLVENAEILAAAADEAMLFLDARYIQLEQEITLVTVYLNKISKSSHLSLRDSNSTKLG